MRQCGLTKQDQVKEVTLVTLRKAFRGARPSSEPGWAQIIVPITDVEADDRLLQVVERIALRKQVAITIVYVVEVAQSMPLDAELPMEISHGEHVLREAQEHIASHVPGKQCSINTELLQARSAGAAIVDEAIDRDAGAIILSAHIQRKHGHMTLGDTVDYVLKRAHCEVLLIREKMPDWLIPSMEPDVV